MTLDSIEDITPYDIYSTLTVRDSVPAEHVWSISEYLLDTLLDDDKPNRLTVSQPPRTAKSSLITLSFPFWLILMNPEFNILIVNYSQDLANDFGLLLRQLFLDNQELLAERDIFVSDKEFSKSKFRFENGQGRLLGSIRLVGTGGAITGRDVDICIVDDYIKGFDDCTPTQLDKLYNWFKGVLLQRLEPHSKLFILATRWHSQDIIGRLQEDEPDKYRFVEIPAINPDGSCIWSNRYTPDFFMERRKEIGDRLFESLYQQRPLDETGDFFNTNNLIFVDEFNDSNLVVDMVRSYDCAYSDEDPSKNNDYTGYSRMLKVLHDQKYGDYYYLITDVGMEKWGDNLINNIKDYARIDTPNTTILVETGTKGGAGEFLYKEYRKYMAGYNFLQSLPDGSKVDRATPFKNAILDGKIRILLPDNKRELLLQQLRGFPYASHDDLVDSLAYAYNYLELSGGDNARITGVPVELRSRKNRSKRERMFRQ